MSGRLNVAKRLKPTNPIVSLRRSWHLISFWSIYFARPNRVLIWTEIKNFLTSLDFKPNWLLPSLIINLSSPSVFHSFHKPSKLKLFLLYLPKSQTAKMVAPAPGCIDVDIPRYVTADFLATGYIAALFVWSAAKSAWRWTVNGWLTEYFLLI